VLLGLACVLGACAGAATPEEAAQAMVDVVLPPGWKGSFDNLTATPSDQLAAALKAWTPALERVTGETKLITSLFTYIAGVRSLYPNGTFAPARAAELAARIAALPPEVMTEWQTRMKAVSGETPDKVNAVLQLIQVDRLWDGGRFEPRHRASVMQRLSSIPREAIVGWKRVSNDEEMVALSLLQVDVLYQGDAFDAALFTKALPAALERYTKAAAALE
jgi:hypothetical protein